MAANTTANQTLVKVLKYTGIFALALGVIGGLLGYLIAGNEGLVSALIGTAVAVLFAGITAASLLFAINFDIVAFFGIVLGSWLIKMVLFIVVMLMLRDQPFINSTVLFVSLVVAILGTVTIETIVVFRSRIPYASNAVFPGPENNADNSTDE